MGDDGDTLWEMGVKLEKTDGFESKALLSAIYVVDMIKNETNSILPQAEGPVKSLNTKYTAYDREATAKYCRQHLKAEHELTSQKSGDSDENQEKCDGPREKSATTEKPFITTLCEGDVKEGPSGIGDRSGILCLTGVQCQTCNQVYSNDLNLRKHVYNVHKMVRVNCNVCDKIVNKKSLGRHMKNVHRVKVEVKKDMKSSADEQRFPCALCSRKCLTLLSLLNHVRTVHEEGKYKCGQCEFRGTRKLLEKHVRKEHNNEVYRCGICQKVLKSKSTLKEHMWMHTDQRRFICYICGLRFKRTSNYRGHMKSHQEKKFQCRICGNFFLRKRYLAVHEQTIHNYYGDGVPPKEKGYQCEICGVKLRWKNNLQAHMRIHTGEKPYKCKICQGQFTCHGSLRTHLAKHCLSIPVWAHDLEILGSGIAKLKRSDMLMRFFITLQHHGRKPRRVFVQMIECCENVSEDDLDCESFRLHEDYIRIPPGMIKNVTLIHPNIYVYNRKGSCLLGIWHHIAREEKTEDKPTEMRHRIPFDTTVKTSPQEVPTVLQGFYDPRSVSKCETKDLDPFDDCSPVNCYIKYSGYRNFYNPKRKKCQKVPVCVGDPRKELADIVYVPNSNTCRDLEKMVTEEDILDLINGKIKEPDLDIESSSVNIQCHHGEIDVGSGLCICDYGWKSEPYDPDSGSAIYHMCNVQCHKSSRKYPLIPFLIGIFVAFWMLLCICFCEKYRFACQFMQKVAGTSHGNCSCTHYLVEDNAGCEE